MDLHTLVNALGGLAIFLLGMRLMTEGLTRFAANRLKTLLANWTSTPWRGVGVGVLVTGLVQSSSAVTVATIGFVNAGILNLRQAIGVIFGTNIGTTMTAWLVSLAGVGFDLEALALPIITVGVGIRLVASASRWKGMGDALTGFGLFFLGLELLTNAFEGLAANFGTQFSDVVTGTSGSVQWVEMMLVGFIATLLTQSSSASIALILTASAGGIMNFEAAAAAVIGANIGTTSTAALATLKATPAAKRLALSHIGFNLITGVVALCLLPLMLALVAVVGHWLALERSPTAMIALFHSLFNILGVVLLLPFTGRIATFLERFFHSAEEDMGRPHYLDFTLNSTPELAVSALRQELMRLSDILDSLLRDALSGARSSPELERRADAISTLSGAITAFITRLHAEVLERHTTEDLANALYCARYCEESAPLMQGLRRVAQAHEQLQVAHAQADAKALGELLEQAEHCLTANPQGDVNRLSLEQSWQQQLDKLSQSHRHARRQLLEDAVASRLPATDMEGLLEALDMSRRALELRIKAASLLNKTR